MDSEINSEINSIASYHIKLAGFEKKVQGL